MAPKVLVISNYGGAINPVRPEAEIFLGLQNRGMDITVMTQDDSYYARKFTENGMRVINYRPKNKFDPKAIRLIKNQVDNEGINVVHAFNSKGIANAAWALMGRKTKLVGYRGYTGNIHWYDPTCYLSFLNPRVDYMICLAESVREVFLENGMSPAKAITINKGHDASWYNNIAEAGLSEFHIPTGAMVCAFVANHRIKMKGLKYLVEAITMLPPEASIYFLLIGEGLDQPSIQVLVKQLPHPERVIFTGFRKNVSELVKASDVAISASVYGEATQKAMIEAMYLGKPVIMTDISGNRGMAEDAVSGFVVPTHNAQAIAYAILKLWENPPLRKKMGTAAHQQISEVLSLEKTITEYKSFYESIT